MRSCIYNRAMKNMHVPSGRYHPGHAGLLGPLVLILALMSLLLSSLGCGEEQPPTLQPQEEETAISSIAGLSAEQSRTIEELGYPDHFFIAIDPTSSDRIEKWIYFSEGKALDFDNGRLSSEEPIEDESAEYPPTDLRPQDFDVLITPGEAEQLLGQPIYTHEVQESLMPENTIIVYDQAVLLYREGQLISVDTKVKPPQIPGP